jgi:acyl-CoA thioesterase-1
MSQFKRSPASDVRCRYGPARWFVNAGFLAVLVIATILPLGISAAAEPFRLLVLGDSLTAGYGLPRTEAFPAQLERALRADGIAVTVVDGGVSGDTTAGGLARLQWVLGGKPGDHPDAVIVELGGNDVLRGLSPRATEANLDAILSKLNESGLPVLLAGMKAPPNLGVEYRREFDVIYPRLAEQHQALFYPFFLEGVAGVAALNQADGIHPNARGVAEIVKRIAPLVTELSRRSKTGSAER